MDERLGMRPTLRIGNKCDLPVDSKILVCFSIPCYVGHGLFDMES